MSAGISRVAVFASPPKKSLPLTFTRVTCLPCAVMSPFLSTDTPGSFFSRSSTIAFGLTRNESALNSTVSSFTWMGGTETITSWRVE